MLTRNLFFFLLPFFMFLQTCHALQGFSIKIVKDANTKDWVDGKVTMLLIANQPIIQGFVKCTDDSQGRTVTRLNDSNQILLVQCNGYSVEWNTNYGQNFGKLYDNTQIYGATTCNDAPVKTYDDGSSELGSECTIQQ